MGNEHDIFQMTRSRPRGRRHFQASRKGLIPGDLDVRTWDHLPAALLFFAWSSTIFVCTGCERNPRSPSPVGPPPAANSRPVSGVGGISRELWYLESLFGETVGYEKILIRSVEGKAGMCRQVEGENQLRVKRAGTPVSLVTRYYSLETCEGRPIEFFVEMEQAKAITRYNGTVTAHELIVETEVAGRKSRQVLPLARECRGFLGVQDALWEKPMKPHEVRRVDLLIVGITGICQAELRSRDYELVELEEGTRQLLRVEIHYTLPGNHEMRETVWTDDSGLIVKHELESPPVVAVLAPPECALRQTFASVDLIEDIRIPARTPRDLAKAVRAVYKITGRTEDLRELLETGTDQVVRAGDDGSLLVVVSPRRLDPSRGSCGDVARPQELKPSLWIQSDAPKISALAEPLMRQHSSPFPLAQTLERFVFQTVKIRDYNQAFLSALDVLEIREGDCTEHAVLLAALARACGIPSRVAVGLLYDRDAFYYHMWTELLIDGCWFGLDATRGNGGLTPGYIKLGHDALADSDPMIKFLPVTKLLGQINIEILEVE